MGFIGRQRWPKRRHFSSFISSAVQSICEDLEGAGDRCKVRDRTASCCSPHLTRPVDQHHAALQFRKSTGSRHRGFRISASRFREQEADRTAAPVPLSQAANGMPDTTRLSARLLLRPPHGRLIRGPLTRSSEKMKRPTHSPAIFHEGFRARFLQLPWCMQSFEHGA